MLVVALLITFPPDAKLLESLVTWREKHTQHGWPKVDEMPPSTALLRHGNQFFTSAKAKNAKGAPGYGDGKFSLVDGTLLKKDYMKRDGLKPEDPAGIRGSGKMRNIELKLDWPDADGARTPRTINSKHPLVVAAGAIDVFARLWRDEQTVRLVHYKQNIPKNWHQPITDVLLDAISEEADAMVAETQLHGALLSKPPALLMAGGVATVDTKSQLLARLNKLDDARLLLEHQLAGVQTQAASLYEEVAKRPRLGLGHASASSAPGDHGGCLPPARVARMAELEGQLASIRSMLTASPTTSA
mmetsp:Transcript_33870/g.79729  ORF Transcript_33870/g.79729 Transcript_33870/m.79729 type:complete len:301 (+) Transcript_33870:62-964(+)